MIGALHAGIIAAATPRASGGGGPDPYFANVSGLLHFDGADGSTSLIDSGPNAETFSVAGDAAITTDQSKFGGSAFETTTGRARCTNATPFLFEDGDFTVEAWAYLGSIPASDIFLCGVWGSGSTTQLSWYFGINNTGKVSFYHRRNASNIFATSTSSVATGSWTHLAFTRRSGNNVSFWINGASAGYNGATPGTFALQSTAGIDFTIGATHANIQQWGSGRYIDEVRVTQGVARYTAPFTPPSSPFPDA